MTAKGIFSIINNQEGISAVIVAVCLVMLIGFIALSIDVSHLVVARNELQNAADAGALAGAGELYNDSGKSVNTILPQPRYFFARGPKNPINPQRHTKASSHLNPTGIMRGSRDAQNGKVMANLLGNRRRRLL